MTSADLEPLVLRPDRRGTYAALGAGAAFGAAAAAMIAGGDWTGWILAGVAGVGLVAGLAGLVPRLGHLRLDEQGFAVKGIGKSWSALWLETEGFSAATVTSGRGEGEVDVVEVHYQAGMGDRHLPRRWFRGSPGLDERYVVAAYGGLSNDELAGLLERYRARYS